MRGFAVLLRLLLLAVVISVFVAPQWFVDVPETIVFEPFTSKTHVIAAAAIVLFLLIEVIALIADSSRRQAAAETVGTVRAVVTSVPGKILFRPKLIAKKQWDAELTALAGETGRYYEPRFKVQPSESNDHVIVQLSDGANNYFSQEQIYIGNDRSMATLDAAIEQSQRRLFHEYIIVLRRAHAEVEIEPVKGEDIRARAAAEKARAEAEAAAAAAAAAQPAPEPAPVVADPTPVQPPVPAVTPPAPTIPPANGQVAPQAPSPTQVSPTLPRATARQQVAGAANQI